MENSRKGMKKWQYAIVMWVLRVLMVLVLSRMLMNMRNGVCRSLTNVPIVGTILAVKIVHGVIRFIVCKGVNDGIARNG